MKGCATIEESIAVPEIFELVHAAMQQSGEALVKQFGFDHEAHFQYIEKIIGRFRNPYLKDDVTRVGREPVRKLSPDDGEEFRATIRQAPARNRSRPAFQE